MRHSLRVALLAAALALGCSPSIPVVERPAVITVIYDPANANLPTPNDLALSNGVVAIAPSPDLTDVENAFKATFNGKKGFSSASSARAQFSAPISAASVTQASLLAYDLGVDGKGPVAAAEVVRAYSDCDQSVSFSAPAGFVPKHRYLFAVRGGESGVKGPDGEEVVAAPAFYYLRAGKDLREHASALPGATRGDRRDTAERLEAVRAQLEPNFAILETQGVPRAQVAALWTFTVLPDTEAYQDPNSKRIPMPNDLLKDPVTGLVTLPADPKDSETLVEFKRAFNQLDGFSTTAAQSLIFSAPVDRATVTAQTVRLVKVDGAVEVNDVDRSVSADGLSLVLQPKTPLLPGTKYVVVVAGVRDTQGVLVAPTPLSSLLALTQPLVTPEGASLLSMFCADTVGRLEPLRQSVASVVDATNLSRTNLNGAWAFTTQDLVKRAQELWSAPYVHNLDPALTHLTKEDNLGIVPYFTVTGRLTTYDRLDKVKRAFRENGSGTPREIDFVLTVPKSVAAGGTVRAVVFGHGLNTERRLSLLLADKLARAGFALISIDLPYHGERTACLADGDCSSGATCAADGACLKDGQVVDFARSVAIPGIPGEGFPSATGKAFIDVERLPGTRDHFRQSVIDLSATTRAIKLADWKTATGGIALDPNDIRYAGISLGGILGGLVSGIDPTYRAMLLNVGGAGLVDLMRESATFGPTLKSALAAKGVSEGTPEYDSFLNAAKWMLDEIDPINFAPYARKRPLVYADPATNQPVTAPVKALRLHMATGDSVVPNTATMRLVAATGVDESLDFRAFVGTHIFLADPVEPSCYIGQDDMVTFMENH